MKRILSICMAIVLLCLLPLTVSAAGETITAAQITGNGYFPDSDSGYWPDLTQVIGTYQGGQKNLQHSYSRLYTDQDCRKLLTKTPEPGETYYFLLTILKENEVVNSFSNASFNINGFSQGKIVNTKKINEGDQYTCSIMCGYLTGGVKAVASGVQYDSAKGGYTPNFTTLYCVSTEGAKLNHTTSGSYSYYGASASCLYESRSGTTFSNKVTDAPMAGQTYYGYLSLESVDGNLHISKNLVDIQIPGYQVTYLDAYERDMGFTSMVVYSATKQLEQISSVQLTGMAIPTAGMTGNSWYDAQAGNVSGGIFKINGQPFRYSAYGNIYVQGFELLDGNKNLLSGDASIKEGNYYYSISLFPASDHVFANNVSVSVEGASSVTTERNGDTMTIYARFSVKGNGHTHKDHLTYVPASTPDCSQGGNIAFYQCSCGKYFKDANATVEYKNGDQDVILSRTDHVDKNNDGKCDHCGKTMDTGTSGLTQGQGKYTADSSFKVGGTATIDKLATCQSVMDDPKVTADIYNAALEGNMSYHWVSSNGGTSRDGQSVTWTQADVGKEFYCMVAFYSDKDCVWYLDHVISQPMIIQGNTVEAPQIITQSLPEATVGMDYYVKLGCTDPDATFGEYYNPGKANQLAESGLYITQHGELEGIPVKAGTYTFTICAAGEGGEGYATYTLVVKEATEDSTEPSQTETEDPAAPDQTPTENPVEPTKESGNKPNRSDKNHTKKDHDDGTDAAISIGNILIFAAVGAGILLMIAIVVIMILTVSRKKRGR